MKQINLEEVTTVSRLDAAQEQIDVAIELFFSGRLLASITLAAAAERVLSDLLKKTGQSTSSAVLRPYFEQAQQSTVNKPKDFYTWQKEVYDWLRHADRQPDATQEVSPYEALMWIMSSIASLLKFGGMMTASIRRFTCYWEESIKGKSEN